MNEPLDLDSRIDTNWIVITGAPSSGKSSLIKKLLDMGHQVCNDVAREIIQEINRKRNPLDEKRKQLLIVERLLEKYSAICRKQVIFLDYGMPDNLVFQALAGFQLDLAIKAARAIRYRAVFLLEPLKIDYDGIRNLDTNMQRSIHMKILNKYMELNYRPIVIPSTDLQSRLERILIYLEDIL
jgi:predicted ATPase